MQALSGSGSPQQRAGMSAANTGMQMAQMGQRPPMQAQPMQRTPVMQGGPPVPQASGQMQQQGQLTPNTMSQYLFRGLMGQ